MVSVSVRVVVIVDRRRRGGLIEKANKGGNVLPCDPQTVLENREALDRRYLILQA